MTPETFKQITFAAQIIDAINSETVVNGKKSTHLILNKMSLLHLMSSDSIRSLGRFQDRAGEHLTFFGLSIVLIRGYDRNFFQVGALEYVR
jgi:hypothetical protein